MTGRRGMEVSLAVAEAARLCRVEVVAAYPITPQTHIVEHLSELVANGDLDANFITVESEHSALSACVGAAAAGARTFTSSSSQGLELMHEVLFIASGLRLPIVLVGANRALSAPLNIWNDHSDVMATRDTGWIMLFCTNGQEAIDTVIMAYRIAEDRRVLIPVMVNIDGFTLTHVVEPVEFPAQDAVDAFLPPYNPAYTLHPDKPVTMGAYGIPEIYTECKFAQEVAMNKSKDVVIEIMDAFGRHFGRSYKPVETYLTEDAEIVFVALGAINETIMTAIDELRSDGKKAGLINLRLYRPFPAEELLVALEGKKRVAIVERVMPGGAVNSPLYHEITSLAYRSGIGVLIKNYVIALGGRDALQSDFHNIFRDIQAAGTTDTRIQKGLNFAMIGVRE
ncbi:MAG TPA: transketolase C-terminal domain-containing protein [Syntrophorhabdales bacterium]|nr:transketolase C-terminal domain-containing protein [Syntrophorhabdales bacterium]